MMPGDKNSGIHDLLHPAAAIVREAGHLLTGAEAGSSRQAAKPGTANYVTDTDYAVQSLIQDKLRELTPDYPLLSEEMSRTPDTFLKPTWILDPVDGTTNLMFQLQHSAISLALWQNGDIVLAVVCNPFLDELFTAVAGKGAWLNGRPIRVRSESQLSRALIGFGTTPYDRSQARRTFQVLETVFLSSFEIRRSGAAVLDLAYIACGRLDGFFELSLQPWDYAAGILLIQEAGGQISNWSGQPVSLEHPDSVLAASQALYPALLEQIHSLV